jgi:hypothetical protein
VLLFLSWQLGDRFGAKAAESKLAQGPDRRGARDHLRSHLHSAKPRGFSVAGCSASGKVEINCAMLGYIIAVDMTEAKSTYCKLRTVSLAQRRQSETQLAKVRRSWRRASCGPTSLCLLSSA